MNLPHKCEGLKTRGIYIEVFVTDEQLVQWECDSTNALRDQSYDDLSFLALDGRVLSLIIALRTEREKSKRLAERASRYEEALKLLSDREAMTDLLKADWIVKIAREALASGGGE